MAKIQGSTQWWWQYFSKYSLILEKHMAQEQPEAKEAFLCLIHFLAQFVQQHVL